MAELGLGTQTMRFRNPSLLATKSFCLFGESWSVGVWSEFCAQGPSRRLIIFPVPQCFLLGRDVIVTPHLVSHVWFPSFIYMLTWLELHSPPISRFPQDSLSVSQVWGSFSDCSVSQLCNGRGGTVARGFSWGSSRRAFSINDTVTRSPAAPASFSPFTLLVFASGYFF